MNCRFLAAGLLSLLLAGCGQGSDAGSAANVPPTALPASTPTIAPTTVPTSTPAPTSIPLASLDLSDLLIPASDPLPSKLKASGDARPAAPEKGMQDTPAQGVMQDIRVGTKKAGGVSVWLFETPNEAINYYESIKDDAINLAAVELGERGASSIVKVSLPDGPLMAGQVFFVRCSAVARIYLTEQADPKTLAPYLQGLDKRIQATLCPPAVALNETPVATLRPTSTPAPTETPVPTKVVASALKNLGIPQPPNSTIFSPGIMGADTQATDEYIANVSKILTSKYPENNIELVAQEVFFSSDAISDMRTYYDVQLQGTGWTFLQGGPMDKGQSVIYTRSVSGSSYGLHVTILPDVTDMTGTPATLVFLTVGRTSK